MKELGEQRARARVCEILLQTWKTFYRDILIAFFNTPCVQVKETLTCSKECKNICRYPVASRVSEFSFTHISDPFVFCSDISF
jgi:hypothetical protein